MVADFSVLAERLRVAYGRGPVSPLRDGLAPEDAEGAYAIQELNTRHWIESGRRVVGRKIGLTAAAVQKQLGVDRPDFGVLFADMQIADGAELRADKVLQPKAEAEIALVMARDLNSPEASAEDVLAAVDCVMAAIEIVDSRIADWKITFADTVADNGSSAFFVLGPPRRPAADLDLRTCGMILEVNGEPKQIGSSAAILGHPLRSLVAAARIAEAAGEPLRAGDIVMAGGATAAVALERGQHIRLVAQYIGRVEFRVQA